MNAKSANGLVLDVLVLSGLGDGRDVLPIERYQDVARL
jgi:hypothetical protein